MEQEGVAGTGKYQPLFPYFGGKSSVADVIWRGLGQVEHYIEPFFGSGAVLFLAPYVPKMETVNDADGLLANAWRSVKLRPDETAQYADWPVNEADLTARHLWLVRNRESLTDRLMADPEWCDPKAAGWWIWGISAWLGGGWCSGRGGWTEVDGVLRRVNKSSKAAAMHSLSDHHQPLLPAQATGNGVDRKLPKLANKSGIHRRLLYDANDPCEARSAWLRATFRSFASRLRHTAVACGDWSRVCSPVILRETRMCGVFLDPPYGSDRSKCYANDSWTVATDVRNWAAEHGRDPGLRIVLAGHRGEGHEVLEEIGWRRYDWKARGGYGNQSQSGRGRENAEKEALWFSPHCEDFNSTAQGSFDFGD